MTSISSTRVLAAVFRNGFHGRHLARGLNEAPLLRAFSALPPHEVVGLPALSPTMEMGTIAEWLKAPGDEIAAGDVVCQIETDKATVDFEAQDESVLAKILVEAGAEVPVGVPICVMVDEVDDVAAFSDFVVEAAAAAEEPPPPTAAPVVTAPEPAPVPTPPVPTPAPVVVAEAPEPAVVVADVAPPQVATTTYAFKRWGTKVSTSPLATKMAKDQIEYISKYGSTLQVPISK